MMDVRRREVPPRRSRRSAGQGGASPLRTAKPARQWNFRWLKPLLLWLVYGGLFSGIVASIVWLDPKTRLENLMNRPIAGVSVESEFKYIAQQQTQQLVEQHLSPTFLELDMLGLKKRWKPTLDRQSDYCPHLAGQIVSAHPRAKPIARWGTEGFINMRGEIVRVSDAAQLTSLPVFDCEERYAAEVMQQYQVIKNIVAGNGFTPVRLTLDKTLAWTLEFSPALTIRLGRKNPRKIAKYSQNFAHGIIPRSIAHEQNRHALRQRVCRDLERGPASGASGH